MIEDQYPPRGHCRNVAAKVLAEQQDFPAALPLSLLTQDFVVFHWVQEPCDLVHVTGSI